MCRCGVVIHVQRAVDYVVVDPNGCGIGIDQQVAADCIADATLGGRPADFDWAGVFLHLQIAIDLGAANRTLGEASGQAVDLQIAADCRAGAESECARSTLSYYDVVLAIYGPAAVCIVPAGTSM